MIPEEKVLKYLERGEIEIAPLAFMRGRTLANSFIILDEAQNTTTVQMKMFLTRLGENSQMVVTGDLSQIDLPHGVVSGLSDATRILAKVKGVEIINFKDSDVIRNPMVAKIVQAYRRAEEKQKRPTGPCGRCRVEKKRSVITCSTNICKQDALWP